MRLKFLFFILAAMVLGVFAGWYAARHWPPSQTAAPAGRKILYYQSAMHPWIKSARPGKCTICGMDLVPVYEGEKGFAVSDRLVTLNSNSITVLHVQTEPLRRRSLDRTLRVAGILEENDTHHKRLSAYVDGRIDKLAVNFVGAEVVEGQPLATLYSPAILAAEREFVTLLRPQPASDTARAERENLLAAATQRLKRLGLTQAQIDLLPQKTDAETHTEILAPMTGTVVQREIYEGQYVKEGDKLFELADYSTLWFRFDVYERDLPWIQPGQILEITTPAAPGQVFAATVGFVEPAVNDSTRSAKVRAEVSNPVVENQGQKQRALRQKLYAEARVTMAIPEVLAIPRSAVLSPAAQPVAYVDKGGGSYEQRALKLGRSGNGYWELLDGVAEGERVVTEGNLMIDAQAQLNQSIQPAAAAPAATPDPHPAAAAPVLLKDDQVQAARDFLEAASTLAAALASDKIESYNQAAGKFHTATPALQKAAADIAAWKPYADAIGTLGHLATATNLASARAAFLPFSAKAVDFAKYLRRQDDRFKSLKIYHCPMAPKPGLWLQLQGPLHNPFFGAEMPDCGEEVP